VHCGTVFDEGVGDGAADGEGVGIEVEVGEVVEELAVPVCSSMRTHA
jgi:hypothetical protein